LLALLGAQPIFHVGRKRVKHHVVNTYCGAKVKLHFLITRAIDGDLGVSRVVFVEIHGDGLHGF
jgi:hypothetical protein